MTATLRRQQYTFMIIFRLILRGMQNVSDKSCTENQKNTFFMSNDFFKLFC